MKNLTNTISFSFNFIIRKFNRVIHLSFEKIYKLDNVKSCNEIGIDPQTSNEHAPTTDYLELSTILLKHCPIKNSSIMDIGCGSGAALALFRMFPFKQILGVELSKTLAQKAAHNFKSSKRVKIFQSDALNFNYSKIEIFFMFNPFPLNILRQVIEKIIQENGMDFYLIYRNPKYLNEILVEYKKNLCNSPMFYKTSNSTYCILKLSKNALPQLDH